MVKRELSIEAWVAIYLGLIIGPLVMGMLLWYNCAMAGACQ